MDQNINIEFIVTTLKMMPAKYNTPAIKIAKGRFIIPTSIKQIFKKFKNG